MWSRSLNFQFLSVGGREVEVFKVFSLDRIQPRFVEQITSAFQLLTVLEEVIMEVFKASPRDRAQQRFVEQISSFLQLLTAVEEVLVEVFKASPRDRAQQRFVEQHMLALLCLAVEIFIASPRDRALHRFVAQITSTFPFLMVVLEIEVFRVSPEDRDPQCLPVSRSSVLLVEVCMVLLVVLLVMRTIGQNALAQCSWLLGT